jgi:hypothetical protein
MIVLQNALIAMGRYAKGLSGEVWEPVLWLAKLVVEEKFFIEN